jgi:hypothetical protein
MKNALFLLCLMIFLSGSVFGQTSNSPYSIVVHAAGGYGEFESLVNYRSTEYLVVALGVDEKWNFSEHWALVIGLDYQYWYFMNYYVYGGAHSVGSPPDNANGPIIRFPIRFEYQKDWYYVALGALVEKGFGDNSDNDVKDIVSLGPTVEIGGRIRLSEKSTLRIGPQISAGHTFGIGKYQSLECSRVEASLLLRIGYEYHF